MGKREKLKKLWEKGKKDDLLPLKKGSTKFVFGVGNAKAEILFIGEGPGYWEDLKGIPFVGRAGGLLDDTLALIKLDRESVFITNVVMHRPPNNRDPSAEEIGAYKLYLDGIIDTLKPKMIVTLGRFSMAKFMPGVYISQVHGIEREINWKKGRKIVVVPMYHPAAALRNGQVKRKFVEDFKRLPEILKGFEKREESDSMNEMEQMALV